VLNSGLILSGRSTEVAFAQIAMHPTVTTAMSKGAVMVAMPRLACMSQVTDRGLTFVDAMNGVSKNGQRPLALFDKARVRKWWNQEIPVFYKEGIPEHWLPEMNTLSRVPVEEITKELKKRGRPSVEASDNP
jgi:hypothetical protein